jgi:hypothetical protein
VALSFRGFRDRYSVVAAIIAEQESDTLSSRAGDLSHALRSANITIAQLEQELAQAKSGLEFWKTKATAQEKK